MTSKKLYTTKLLAEVGFNSDAPNKDYSQVSISKKVIITTNITNCENVTFTFTTKLFQLYAGFLTCKKHLLVQDLLFLLKLVALNHYLILFQKYLKWSVFYVESFYNKSWKNV